MAIWAIYASIIQYTPVVVSIGFVFLGFISKSTIIHFLSNTIKLSWLFNICFEYKFMIKPSNKDCIVSLKMGDIQLIGPTFAFPPIEITQSSALITFFLFYLFFWKKIWHKYSNINGMSIAALKSEFQERCEFLVVLIILLVQNPLLLAIRNVYSLFGITIGIVLGVAISGNIILFYLISLYLSHIKNIYQKREYNDINNIGAFPYDDPFPLLTLTYIPN
jgi:hypothetical protein